jgi:hypothetical protein
MLAGIILIGGLLSTVSLQAWGQGTSRGIAPKRGKITGIVTEKTDTAIAIKPEGRGPPVRYGLFSAAGGPPSADVQAALKTVFVTNLVALEWQGERGPVVVTSIHAIHPKARFGVVTGFVTAVEPAANMPSFDVRPSDRGFTERYVPRWDAVAKGWDANLARTIAALNVGDKVKVAWSYDERKRATQIQVLWRPEP